MRHTILERIKLYRRGIRGDFSIAECYETGQHVAQDIDMACLYYRKAIIQGDKRAFGKLGQLYERQGKIYQALNIYYKGALQADLNAKEHLLRWVISEDVEVATVAMTECYIGIIFEHELNWEKAQEWYRKAIAKQHAYAMYRLGCLYQSDRVSRTSHRVVITKDILGELNCYKQSAAWGDARALDQLVTIIPIEPIASLYLAQLCESTYGNIPRAAEYYEKSSSFGNRDAAFRLGQLYEEGTLKKTKTTNVQAACKYYLVAANHLHQESISALERLLKGGKDAQLEYEFGEVYYASIKDKIAALRWYLRAAEHKHEVATTRLSAIAESDAEFAYVVARSYEEGSEKVARNIQKAVSYYVVAIRRDHAEAKKSLEVLATAGNVDAQYALGSEYFRTGKNLLAAIVWMVKAAEQQHKPAVTYLTTTSFSSDILVKIASIYECGENVAKNMRLALVFYTKASALGDMDANFKLGQLYEDRASGIAQDRLKAFTYYAFAMRQNHLGAKVHLEQMAVSGDADAQYALGFNYYRQKGDITEAVRWCVSAEMQEHKLALTYLTTIKFSIDVYLHIAQQYELDQTNPRRSILRALEFYSQMADLGDQESALRLAQFYQVEHMGVKVNLDKAFDYYMKAAKLGCQDAWVPLERLGEEMSVQKQMTLSRMYGSFFNGERAAYWSTKAGEIEGFIFKM